MVVTNEDRYAVLERKLMEAESALFGCRQILQYIIRSGSGGRGLDRDEETVSMPGVSGLYPGQLPDPTADKSDTEECVE